MPPSLTRQEAERLVNTYADLILRLSYTYLSHPYVKLTTKNFACA